MSRGAPLGSDLGGAFQIIGQLTGMPLRIGEDLQEEAPGGRIAIPDLPDQGGVGGHLLSFQHEVLNDHLPQCGALLGAHASGSGLRGNLQIPPDLVVK